MQDHYQRLFFHLEVHEPSHDFLVSILGRVAQKRVLSARVRMGVFSTLSLGALVALFPAWQELRLELVQSGFSQLFSLLFSDGGTLIALWKDFVFSLAESLPFMGISFFLGSAFIFLFSLRSLSRVISIFSYRSNNIQVSV